MSFDPATAAHSAVLTIPARKIDAPLTNFPLPVLLPFHALSIYKDLGAAGKLKMAVTDASGNQCYVEIEFWGLYSQVIHVRVPAISATDDTVLTIHWDAAQDDNAAYVGETGSAPAQQVWDDDFVAVYHMAQDPSGPAPQILDSTSNHNHGTSHGSMTSGDLVEGAMGTAIEFDGADDYIDCGQDASLHVGGGPFTLEASFKVFSISSWNVILSKRNSSYKELFRIATQESSGKLSIFTENSAGTHFDLVLSPGLSVNVNYHLGYVRDGASAKAFLNGDFVASRSVGATDLFDNSSANLLIGRKAENISGDYIDGVVGEIRISSTARSDAWISATALALKAQLIEKPVCFQLLSLPVPSVGLMPQLAEFRSAWYTDPFGGHLVLPAAGRLRETGVISGTVAVSGAPARRRVTLLDHLTLKPVAQTWSDPETGEYEFTGLATGKRYLVICDDYTQTYNAAVADWVEAE